MIILLGATGYVGEAFAAELQQRQLAFRSVSRQDIDYTRPDALRSLLRECAPEFLINAAGYTGKPNVDACELDKANCLAGNGVLPGLISDVCRELGIPWGHVSSGCIFSGRRGDGEPFAESDAPNFSFRQDHCSFYSGTKALGEETIGYGPGDDGRSWVPTREESAYVWRLRIPFNHVDGPRNYLSKLMRYNQLLDAENAISHLDDFVGACLDCWIKQVPFGIYNVTNPGSVTTREVVGLIEASPLGPRLKSEGKQFSFFPDEDEFMRRAAKTPRSNCVLSPAKLESVGIPLRPVAEAIRVSLENWKTAHS